MKQNKFLAFGSPLIGRKEIEEVVKTLRSGWLSTGPKVEKFEEDFKAYVGAKYACAVSSCSAALHLSLLAAGIKHGDEVITTPLTFASTANAIIHTGAKPVFVDVRRDTMNIDFELIEKKITHKTKAIMPVHFAGRPAAMEEIVATAKKHGLIVIEDAAHAVGAEYHGKKMGAIGDMTCFSFYANKNITTGEGGMVTTDKSLWAKKIRLLSFCGIDQGPWERYSQKKAKNQYQVIEAGYKYNMTDIEASIGIHQLKKVERFLKRREEIWEGYDEAFKDLPVALPESPEPQTRHARHLYTLLLDIEKIKKGRDGFRRLLYKKGIGTGIHFISLHLHPFYRGLFGFKKGDFPCAEYITDRTVSLPLSVKLTNDEIRRIIVAVKKSL